MKKTIAVLAAAALASGAGADWQFEVSGDITPSSPTVTVRLLGGFPRADFAVAGAILDIHASEAGWSELELLPVQIPPTPVPGPYPDPQGRTPGEISGGDVTGAVMGQLHIGPFVADPTNPLPMWEATFSTSDFTPRDISLSTTTHKFLVYYDPIPIGGPRTMGEGAGVIRVIPAPGGLALLGLGGLAAARRRRRVACDSLPVPGSCPCRSRAAGWKGEGT